jgi:hypothetical protein
MAHPHRRRQPILGGLYATALGYGVIGASEYPPSALKQRLVARLKWLGPAVVLFGVFTAWQTHLHVIHPPAEEIVRQITARVTFPSKVDDLTQAVGVEGKGDDIIYHYSIAASLADLGGREKVQTRTRATVARCRLQDQGRAKASSRRLHSSGALLVQSICGRGPGFSSSASMRILISLYDQPVSIVRVIS